MDIILTISVEREVNSRERDKGVSNLRWKIVIYDEGDLLYVNTASPDIGCNQHPPPMPKPK